jgi:hypothetical protein
MELLNQKRKLKKWGTMHWLNLAHGLAELAQPNGQSGLAGPTTRRSMGAHPSQSPLVEWARRHNGRLWEGGSGAYPPTDWASWHHGDGAGHEGNDGGSPERRGDHRAETTVARWGFHWQRHQTMAGGDGGATLQHRVDEGERGAMEKWTEN